MEKVYILGVGQTDRGFFPDLDMVDLSQEAAFSALTDAGLEMAEVKHVWLGRYPPTSDMQFTAGQVVVDALGISVQAACTVVEEACATSGHAMHNAFLGIASGVHDLVLVLGATKYADSFSWANPVSESGYGVLSYLVGVTLRLDQVYDYMKKYGVNEEDIYNYYSTQYWYAVRNPKGIVYGKSVPEREDFERVPYDSYPFRFGTVGAVQVDGASALVLGSERVSRKRPERRVELAAMVIKEESSYGPHGVQYYADSCGPTRFPIGDLQPYHQYSLEAAWREALKMAKVEPGDFDIFQPHEAAIGMSWDHLDMLGHPDIPFGQGAKWYGQGQAMPTGRLPCGTAGIFKAGYVMGAIGLDYVIENVHQLREEAGERQCPLKNYLAASVVSPQRPNIAIVRKV